MREWKITKDEIKELRYRALHPKRVDILKALDGKKEGLYIKEIMKIIQKDGKISSSSMYHFYALIDDGMMLAIVDGGSGPRKKYLINPDIYDIIKPCLDLK